MAQGHHQAYFTSDRALGSSNGLDPAALRSALPGGDGLRVTEIEGLGLVAARRAGDFTHVVAGLEGAFPIELAGWRDTDDGFAPLTAREVDLSFLADAPAGVATRLLDAALSGPVRFYAPDAQSRAAWVAWLTYALPGGHRLTFSTAGDGDAWITAVTDTDGAIDTTVPSDFPASFYARVAVQLAARGELRAAVARLDEPDGLALAVHGGATDLIAPHQLPLALQLITELATSGLVREAARAAAALPSRVTSLVIREDERPLPVVAEPEPEPEEEILEAEVVEEAPLALPEPEDDEWVIRDDEIISVPFEPEVEESFVPRAGAAIPEDVVVAVPFEPEVEEPLEPPAGAIPDDVVVSVPFEPEVEEPLEPEEPFVPEAGAAIPDDVVVSVPFDVEVPEEPAPEPLPDVDAWAGLLAELKTESVTPDERLPVLPDIEALRRRDRIVPPPAPEPEPEPEPAVEETFDFGISLDAFAASLAAAAPPAPEPEPHPEPEPEPLEEVLEEEEVGMSLAELEASLKKEREP